MADGLRKCLRKHGKNASCDAMVPRFDSIDAEAHPPGLFRRNHCFIPNPSSTNDFGAIPLTGAFFCVSIRLAGKLSCEDRPPAIVGEKGDWLRTDRLECREKRRL
jgi:hypothetical protein